MGTGFDITNEDRAELALIAVAAFAAATRQDSGAPVTTAGLQDASNEGWMAREIVGDLLCDLMHLLGEELFEKALESGRHHFVAEVCKFCGGTAQDFSVCDDCGPIRCSYCDELIDEGPCSVHGTHQAWTD